MKIGGLGAMNHKRIEGTRGVDGALPRELHDGVERSRARLYPGQVVASLSPMVVTTVLGSCVAVCVWDTVRGIGGMNHFVLPVSSPDDPVDARFADVAIRRLLAQLTAFGAHREDLRAKLAGGANLLRAFRGGTQSLGERNVEAAIEVLGREQITIVASTTGGNLGRRLIFATDTGGLWSAAIEGGDLGP